jgi:hypothetical protein
MKFKMFALIGLVVAGAAWADGPHFDAHVTCTAEGRKIDLYLNQFGHPQFGFRYEGIGIIDYGARYSQDQFYLNWNFVDGKPVKGTVHDSDGLGSWQFQMEPDKTTGFSDPSKPVTVTEFPHECSMPCDLKPKLYEAKCEANK